MTNVVIFAFGPVGVSGRTSTGELAFRTLARSTNGPELFRSAAGAGTTAGNLYALCGIRLLDRPSFNTLAAPLRTTNLYVMTLSGCCGEQVSAQAVVKQITEGYYDPLFPKSKR